MREACRGGSKTSFLTGDEVGAVVLLGWIRLKAGVALASLSGYLGLFHGYLDHAVHLHVASPKGFAHLVENRP